MGPDATRTVERELSVTAVSANRTVTAVVDAADRVREADESNNEWEGRLLAPDLTLWGGSVDYGAATGGVNVTVSVGNRGASATPATVTLYPENGTPVAATTNISGAADDDTTVFESVRFTGVALAANESVDVVVDSPYERRASDNALTSTVPESVAPDVARPTLPGQPEPAGDVDGDGKLEDVDGNGGADLFDALTYYNERNSDVVENNPSAFDFDGDGTAGTLFDALALFNDISG
jgi:PKD repeat protein